MASKPCEVQTPLLNALKQNDTVGHARSTHAMMHRADSQNVLRRQRDINSEIEISRVVRAQRPHPSCPLKILRVCAVCVDQVRSIVLLSWMDTYKSLPCWKHVRSRLLPKMILKLAGSRIIRLISPHSECYDCNVRTARTRFQRLRRFQIVNAP